MRRSGQERVIDEIACRVKKIVKPVAYDYISCHKELKMLEEIGIIEYIPTPFEIANFYDVECRFVEMEEDIPSYLNAEEKIIYISKKYLNADYEARILCAHELGHFFLHDRSQKYAMNDDVLNLYLAEEIQKEYQANVFSILLMPQIMAGKPWNQFSPIKLNREIYHKVMKF